MFDFRYFLYQVIPYFITFGLCILLLVPTFLFAHQVEPFLFIACLGAISLSTFYGGKFHGFLSLLIISIATYFIYSIYLLPFLDFLSKYFAFVTVSTLLIALQERLITISKEKKKVQEQIQIQKDKLEVVSNSITDSLITINSKSIIVYANPSVKQMFGWESTELLGKPLTVLMPENFRERHVKGLNQYLNTKNRKLNWSAFEIVGLKKDGKEFPIEVSFGEYKSKKDIYFSAVIRDISVRKNLENELKTSDERYKAFIQNSSEGIWRFELRKPCPISLSLNQQIEWLYLYGYFAECNNAMARMYGYDNVDDIIGRPLDFLLPKIVSSKIYLRTFINKKYSISDVESMEKDKNGNLIYFSNSLKGTVIDGLLYRGWGVQRDITSRKKDSIEKEKLLRETEEAKKSAEIANIEKDKFLANLSHELRTPLVSILGYSGLLDENSTKEDILKGLKVINKSAKNQLSLIDDLLDVSKIVANKVILHKEEILIKDLIDEIIESFEPRAISKGLSINTCQGNFKVFADRKRLFQILSNLVSNSIRFTDVGKIDIECWKDDNNFYLSVKDTGIGISKDNLKLIFKPFAQVDASSSKRQSGVGLGLAIVKNLVSLHGGNINVESTLKKGSNFIISIPNTQKEIQVNSIKGLKILIVEDTIDTGELLKVFLISKEAKPTVVLSAKEAHQILSNEKFDLYLVDIAMPEEDGITFLKSLRKNGDKTPAVAISAYTSYEKLALDSGFSLFIEKPIDWEEILNIGNILKIPID